MAGDWIKMRGNLWDDPRVSRLVDLTDSSEAAVIGGLYWLWATADQHTEDGVMQGLSLRQIDRKTGVQGLGQALVDIGWLADHPEGVRIINFEDHNGSSAKKRAQTARRVANYKSANADGDGNRELGNAGDDEHHESGNALSVSAALPREREEKKEKTCANADAFARFWSAYPKKKSKGQAEKAFAKIKPSEQLLEAMLASLERAKTSCDWQKADGQYIPYPATWIAAKGWEDEDCAAGDDRFGGLV